MRTKRNNDARPIKLTQQDYDWLLQVRPELRDPGNVGRALTFPQYPLLIVDKTPAEARAERKAAKEAELAKNPRRRRRAKIDARRSWLFTQEPVLTHDPYTGKAHYA